MNKRIQKTKQEMLLSTKLLGICKITGIAVELSGLPASTAFLEYKNPIANHENCCALINAGLENQPKFLLAGMALFLLKNKKLLESKLSSLEENLLLQEASAKTLIKFLELLSKIDNKNAAFLCKISLESEILMEEKEKRISTVSNFINNKIRIWSELLFPSTFYIDSERIEKAKHDAKPKIMAIKAEKEIKDLSAFKPLLKSLLSSLIEEDVASEKVLNLLRLSTEKDNISSLIANTSLSKKLREVLDSYQNEVASEISEILLRAEKSISNKNRLEALFSDSLERVSDVSLSKPRKTLAEIIAEKRGEKNECL